MHRITLVRFIILGFLFFVANTSLGQTIYLEKSVTLHMNDVPISSVFKSISKQTGVVFSYTQFDDHQKVSANFIKKPLKVVLNELLKPTNCTYKVKGKYIILTVKKATAPTVETIQLAGYIYDSNDSSAVVDASIYIKQNKHTAVSDTKGHFSMSFTKSTYPMYLSIAKENYLDTSLLIQTNTLKQTIVVFLHRKHHPQVKITPPAEVPVQPIVLDTIQEQDSLSPAQTVAQKKTILEELKKAGKELKQFGDSILIFDEYSVWNKFKEANPNFRNINDTFFSRVSFSLFPLISTNKLLSINTINHLSFNLFAGYSRGVDGAEFGTFLNIDNGDVRYFQLAGFSNVVTGNVTGLQIGGFSNINARSMNGIQVGGFGNFNGGVFNGIQLAGNVNINRQSTNGIQVAGFANIVAADFSGIQGSGFVNSNFKKTNGIQLAGFANLTNYLDGMQLSGFANYTRRTMKGIQLAGFMNLADTVDGTQLAGFVNFSGHLIGSQIGVLNFNGSATGVPIGLFSYVHKGYHKVEAFYDEQNYTHFSFRTGVDKLHNIFTVGNDFTRNSGFISLGYGFGSSLRLSKRWYFDMDLTANTIQYQKTNVISKNLLNKVFIGIEFRPIKKISLAVGPTVNLWIADNTDYNNTIFSDSFKTTSFYTTTEGNNDFNAWIGGKISLKIL